MSLCILVRVYVFACVLNDLYKSLGVGILYMHMYVVMHTYACVYVFACVLYDSYKSLGVGTLYMHMYVMIILRMPSCLACMYVRSFCACCSAQMHKTYVCMYVPSHHVCIYSPRQRIVNLVTCPYAVYEYYVNLHRRI